MTLSFPTRRSSDLLYKIVAFMTWLECYGPSLGRMPVPRVQDLVNEERASRWFLLYIVSLVVAVPALLFDTVGLFRTATCAQVIAVAALVLELVRTRHLSSIAADRSEERREGQECCLTGRSRWSPYT